MLYEYGRWIIKEASQSLYISFQTTPVSCIHDTLCIFSDVTTASYVHRDVMIYAQSSIATYIVISRSIDVLAVTMRVVGTSADNIVYLK